MPDQGAPSTGSPSCRRRAGRRPGRRHAGAEVSQPRRSILPHRGIGLPGLVSAGVAAGATPVPGRPRARRPRGPARGAGSRRPLGLSPSSHQPGARSSSYDVRRLASPPPSRRRSGPRPPFRAGRLRRSAPAAGRRRRAPGSIDSPRTRAQPTGIRPTFRGEDTRSSVAVTTDSPERDRTFDHVRLAVRPAPSRSPPTATSRAASTTLPRPASRRSRSRPSSPRSPTTTTRTSAPAPS